MGLFTTKNPTIKEDVIAYTNGGGNTFSDSYNVYVSSVETLDKAIRVIANVASSAEIGIYKKQANGKLKPLKVKNIDLEYNINESDGQSDFLRKVFSSIFTQGASIILAEKSRETGYISFYPYDPAKFKIEASAKSIADKFIYSTSTGNTIEFKAKDVIYTNCTIDVTNLVYPISRLKPLNDMMLLQAAIMKQTTDHYKSGAKDSVIISPKEPMTPDNAKLLQKAFNDFIKSTATQTLFLNTEVDVKSVSNAESPKQIMEALTTINKVIAESFGIPAYLFGDYSGYVNEQAVTTASKLFFEIQVKPVFKSLQHQMTKYFRNTLKIKDAVVGFNFENIEILHDSLAAKTDIAIKLLKAGIISVNEARQMVEFDNIKANDDTADKHWLPAYLVSSRPVSVEDYSELLSQGFFDQAGVNNNPSGNSGEEDNTPALTNDDKNNEPTK